MVIKDFHYISYIKYIILYLAPSDIRHNIARYGFK